MTELLTIYFNSILSLHFLIKQIIKPVRSEVPEFEAVSDCGRQEEIVDGAGVGHVLRTLQYAPHTDTQTYVYKPTKDDNR